MKRPQQLDATGLSLVQADAFLSALASAIEPITIQFSWRPQLADADNEMVLEAAVNGLAGALVTHNIAHFQQAAKTFMLPVLRPGELLARIVP